MACIPWCEEGQEWPSASACLHLGSAVRGRHHPGELLIQATPGLERNRAITHGLEHVNNRQEARERCDSCRRRWARMSIRRSWTIAATLANEDRLEFRRLGVVSAVSRILSALSLRCWRASGRIARALMRAAAAPPLATGESPGPEDQARNESYLATSLRPMAHPHARPQAR